MWAWLTLIADRAPVADSVNKMTVKIDDENEADRPGQDSSYPTNPP